MTNLNVLCIKIRFIVIKIKVAIKKLHIPNVSNNLVINFCVYTRDIYFISNILKMNCVNQNNIQVYGMWCYWQNLIELQSIGFSLNNLLLFSVRN